MNCKETQTAKVTNIEIQDKLGFFPEYHFSECTFKFSPFGVTTLEIPRFHIENAKNLIELSSIHDNQYQYGRTDLKQALIDYFPESVHFKNITDLTTENVLISAGALSGISLAIRALTQPGDEIIMFEPIYPSHLGRLLTYEGVEIKPQLLRFSQKHETYKIDFEKLENSLSTKTRIIIITNPNNPLGKVFTTKEFERLSTLLEKFPRAIILEDQSYFLYYQDGHKPIPVGTLSAETFKKSLTIYSGGKTFNVTGARVGFVLGPREIIKQIAEIQFKEMALASAFEQLVMRDNLVSAHETNFYENIRTKINKIGETVKRVLSKMGFKMLTFEGTYYMVINVEHLRGKIEEKYYYRLDNPAIKTNELDKAFCRKLYLTSKVGLIPLSSLHFKEGALDNLVRVAINRSEEDIKFFLDSMCIFVDS